MGKKKIVFAGGRELGVKVFAWLNTCEWADVVGVVPLSEIFDPDNYCAMQEKIKAYHIAVYDINELVNKTFDIGLSVNFNRIISPEVLNQPKQGFYNIHHSYNLRLKGRNISTQAILNSRKTGYFYHGTTLHKMVPELDAGPIVASVACDITDTDTAYTLFKKTDKLAFRLVKEWMPRIALQRVTLYQPPSEDTYSFRNIDLPSKELDSDSLTAEDFYDYVRAFDYPGKTPAYVKNGESIIPLVIHPRGDYNKEVFLKGTKYYTS